MFNKVVDYINLKILMSIISLGTESIKENELNQSTFYSELYLTKLLNIFNDKFSYYLFDSQKIETIHNMMSYYLEINPTTNNEITMLCTKILDKTKHTRCKNNKDFYKEQYELRTLEKVRSINEDIKIKIDYLMIKDIKIISKLLDTVNGKSYIPEENDLDIMGAINVFISECPDILYQKTIFNCIYDLVKRNEKYTQNENLTKLNIKVKNQLDYIVNHQNCLEEICIKNKVLSFIYNPMILNIIKKLSKEDQELFLSEELLNWLCEFIKENEENCMFDEKKINTIRDLIFLYVENNLISNKKLNEIKISLNVLMDHEYQNKNNQFYKETFNKYKTLNIKFDHLDKSEVTEFKNKVDKIVINTGSVLDSLINFSLSLEDIINDEEILYHIYRIVNEYPIIIENLVYADMIKELIYSYYNYIQIAKTKIDNDIPILCYKLEKKINKLYR